MPTARDARRALCAGGGWGPEGRARPERNPTSSRAPTTRAARRGRAAKLHPERSYYYRPGDAGALIDACNRKLAAQPGNVKALYTRASCLMKQRAYAKAIEDFSVVRTAAAAGAASGAGQRALPPCRYARVALRPTPPPLPSCALLSRARCSC